MHLKLCAHALFTVQLGPVQSPPPMPNPRAVGELYWLPLDQGLRLKENFISREARVPPNRTARSVRSEVGNIWEASPWITFNVEARKWKERYTTYYIAKSLRSQEKVSLGTDAEILWLWKRVESRGDEGDARLWGRVQSISRTIKTAIPRNPIKRAKKFVGAL